MRLETNKVNQVNMLILQGGSTVEVTEVEKQWMSSEACGTVAGVDTKLQPVALEITLNQS